VLYDEEEDSNERFIGSEVYDALVETVEVELERMSKEEDIQLEEG
jgi:hypothetical protein